jgi:hypothetical protein
MSKFLFGAGGAVGAEREDSRLRELSSELALSLETFESRLRS